MKAHCINKFRFGIQCFMLALLVSFPIHLFAQPAPPPNPEAPIDGGLLFLIGSGAAAAIWRYRSEAKSSQ